MTATSCQDADFFPAMIHIYIYIYIYTLGALDEMNIGQHLSLHKKFSALDRSSIIKLKLGGYVVHWIHFEEPKSLLRYFINYHNQASISLITSLIIIITLK